MICFNKSLIRPDFSWGSIACARLPLKAYWAQSRVVQIRSLPRQVAGSQCEFILDGPPAWASCFSSNARGFSVRKWWIEINTAG
jgi:hypothetical protein